MNGEDQEAREQLNAKIDQLVAAILRVFPLDFGNQL